VVFFSSFFSFVAVVFVFVTVGAAFGSLGGRPRPRLGALGSFGGGGGALGSTSLRGRPLPRLAGGASSASSRARFSGAIVIVVDVVDGETR
jgi:hypothetical protein